MKVSVRGAPVPEEVAATAPLLELAPTNIPPAPPEPVGWFPLDEQDSGTPTAKARR
jgi:hypothetical protein